MLIIYSEEWHFCSYPSCYAGNLAIMKLVLLTLQLGMLEISYIFIFIYHSVILLFLFRQMYLL